MTWPPSTRPADEVIRELGLAPLSREGGHFRITTRTARLSSILFLLTDAPDGFSVVHLLDVDEGWQWLAGSEAELFTLPNKGPAIPHRLNYQNPVIVSAGTWQAARTIGAWTLVSCWCAPAFTDDVCIFGRRADLLDSHPDAAPTIASLTRD